MIHERNRRRAAGQKLGPQEYRLLHRDGSILLAEMTSIAIEYEGSPAVMVFMRDRTAHYRLEEQLRHAERMAALGSLAAEVAHEINNPLAYVLANLAVATERMIPEISRETGVDLAPLEDVIQSARNGAERVRAIARDLRVLARAESEDEALVDVREAIDSAISLTTHELRGVATVLRDYGEAPTVRAREGRLVQVLVALLVNAAHAVQGESVSRREIAIRTSTTTDGAACIEVQDHGVGMSKEVAQRIFEPFFTTKSHGVGTGLGLPIARGIVESLGGKISIESEPGSGTTARVVLPAARAAKSSRVAPATEGRAYRVLVIDDEPYVARALALALADAETVRVATSGGEALSVLESDATYDVIFCDVMMPLMNGLEVYTAAPGLRERFVFMTGGVLSSDLGRDLAGTGRPCLEKPFGIPELRAAVRQVLSSGRP